MAGRRRTVTFDQVAGIVAGPPEVTEGLRFGKRTWFVRSTSFAWERPFSKADLRRFGDETPPEGPFLAVRVADLGEKEALLASDPDAFFTISHFGGYAAMMIKLRVVGRRLLRETLVDAWLASAPLKLAHAYLEGTSAR